MLFQLQRLLTDRKLQIISYPGTKYARSEHCLCKSVKEWPKEKKCFEIKMKAGWTLLFKPNSFKHSSIEGVAHAHIPYPVELIIA